jgi:hypothetical protein
MNVTLAGTPYPYKPSDDELSRTSIELAAFDGEVGNGILPILDRDSNYDVHTGRQALIEEGAVVLSDGFMLDQDRVRGFSPAVAREYQFGLADANALLDGFRISRRRPAETDVERVLYFASQDGPAWDTTWVIDANTANMPAKRYYSDGGWTSELIPDVVSYTGKTLFLHDKAGGGRCLHYHILTDGHTCGLSISDVIADSLGSLTTFFPQEPQRTRTSIDLRNDVKGVDQAGRVSIQFDATSETDHDADGLLHEAQLDIEASSQSDLDVQTAAFLASQKDDLDTWTCSIGPLDEDALALIRVGDLITVTSTVMGLSASEKRISHMTLTPVVGEGSRARVRWWMAALEIGAPIRRRARVGTRRPAPPTEPFTCVPPDFRVFSDTASPALECVVAEFAVDCQSSTGTGSTFHLYNGATYRVDYLVYHNPNSLDLQANLLADHSPNFVGDLGAVRIPMGSGLFGTAIPFASTEFTMAGDCNVHAWLDGDTPGGPPSENSFSSISATIYYVSGSDPRFEDMAGVPCTNGEPDSGQEVVDAGYLGDGTTTTHTTDNGFAYRPGSLHVVVNGLDWTSDVTESDPTTGEYELAYPPPLNSTVRVFYVAA